MIRQRLADGFSWGIIAGIVCVIALVGAFALVFNWGFSSGQASERRDLQQQGLGRYIEVKLDDRNYSGWLR